MYAVRSLLGKPFSEKGKKNHKQSRNNRRYCGRVVQQKNEICVNFGVINYTKSSIGGFLYFSPSHLTNDINKTKTRGAREKNKIKNKNILVLTSLMTGGTEINFVPMTRHPKRTQGKADHICFHQTNTFCAAKRVVVVVFFLKSITHRRRRVRF